MKIIKRDCVYLPFVCVCVVYVMLHSVFVCVRVVYVILYYVFVCV